jgi:single-stranded-DNA-specific exonuclease
VKILDASKKYLARYWWHAGAAGCSIESSMISWAIEFLATSTHELYSGHDSTPVLTVDSILDPKKITLDTVWEIEKLRPFGMWFSAPLFLLPDISVPILPLGKTGDHIRWDYPGLEILGFRLWEYMDQISTWPVSLIGTLKSHVWRDTITPQFHVLDILID